MSKKDYEQTELADRGDDRHQGVPSYGQSTIVVEKRGKTGNIMLAVICLVITLLLGTMGFAAFLGWRIHQLENDNDITSSDSANIADGLGTSNPTLIPSLNPSITPSLTPSSDPSVTPTLSPSSPPTTALPSTAPTAYCTSVSCLKTAGDIAQSLNFSVAPCDNFYNYVCDGYDASVSWNLVKRSAYGTTSDVSDQLRQNFMDALYYDSQILESSSAVQKARYFHEWCLRSTTDSEEAAHSEIVEHVLNMTSFVESNVWDEEEMKRFQDVNVWMIQHDYKVFFNIATYNVKLPFFLQWDILADENTRIADMSAAFESLAESVFGLSTPGQIANISSRIAQLHADLTEISGIWWGNAESLWLAHVFGVSAGTFENISDVYYTNETELFDYAQMVYDVYGISPSDPALTHFAYWIEDVPFLNGLHGVLLDYTPQEVQYYMWSAILVFYLDLDNLAEQSRFADRADWCTEQTISHFPWVFGLVTYDSLWSPEHEAAMTELTLNVRQAFIDMIKDTPWLDEPSRNASILKATRMRFFIGNPEPSTNQTIVDHFYRKLELVEPVFGNESTFLHDLLTIEKWESQVHNHTFWGTHDTFSLIGNRPIFFLRESAFRAWLTNVNAFYVPWENWFEMPVTISQNPFFRIDDGFPAALNYGGIGAVVGHEMGHGFDQSGYQYNWAGQYGFPLFGVNSTSLEAFNNRTACLANSFSQINIDGFQVNGWQYITEASSDSIGIKASLDGYREHVAKYGPDKKLFGLDFTPEQLFYISYARSWCQTNTPDYLSRVYGNPAVVHPPPYARVVATLQNSAEFKDAWGCETGDFMDPEEKCEIYG